MIIKLGFAYQLDDRTGQLHLPGDLSKKGDQLQLYLDTANVPSRENSSGKSRTASENGNINIHGQAYLPLKSSQGFQSKPQIIQQLV